jgi:serine/threonine protein kinase
LCIFQVYWYGVWKTSNCQEVYYVLAMELLGKSLHDLLKSNWYGLFRLRTVMMLADQVLEILEFLHTQFIIHRDIKPGNLVLGTGENCNKVYLIDFGLACTCAQYSPGDSKCKKHMPNTKYAN